MRTMLRVVVPMNAKSHRDSHNSVSLQSIHSSQIAKQWRCGRCWVNLPQAMPRRSKSIKPRRLVVPAVPRTSCWIESDSYDRRTWDEIRADAPSIEGLIEAGARLVPHFDSLIADLFFGLFKLNVVWQQPAAVRQAAALNHRILKEMVPSPAFEALKARTALEE